MSDSFEDEYIKTKTISVHRYEDDERIAVATIPMYRWRYYLLGFGEDNKFVMAKQIFRKDEIEEMNLHPEQKIVCWTYNKSKAQ